MRKIVYSFVFAALFTVKAQAQQTGLYSQYMFNDYITNPAVCGTHNYTPIYASVRRQWVGITDAPLSQYISANGYVGSNFGIGGAFFNESTGPTRQTGVNISAAYHLVVGQKSAKQQTTLSFGLQGSFSQFILDKTQLTTFEAYDPTIQDSYNYQLIPDVGFGVYLHNDRNYYVGLSAYNLVQTRNDIYNLNNQVVNRLVRNYYLTGGMMFDLNKKWNLQPSVMFRMIEALPFQFDVNTRIIYDQRFWFGVSYRHQDAVVGLLGVRIGQLKFGYSYDYTLSDLKNFNSGSHEVALTFMINRGNSGSRGIGGRFTPASYRPANPSF